MTLQRRPLGCMTGIALLFALLTALVIGVAAIVTGNGIFAPGPLNAEAGETLGGVTSHADLSGSCDACHAQAWTQERMADRCLACHQAIRTELDAGTGLHGLFAPADVCRGCHTEHGGAASALTVANPAGFPHGRTGFALDAHPVAQRPGAFACADCHTESLSTFAAGTCLTCHERLDAAYMAEHVDTFGTTCRSCHDGVDTYGHAFDHATWKLEGKHGEASCAGCHAGSTTLAALRATSTACVSCHADRDIHQGRLGTDCASCHTAATWEEAPAGFDHGLTGFALQGKHVGVECLACHADRQWTGIGTTCEACHSADDPHAGQFDQSCASCHTVAAWEPSTFDHATTRFKLAFAHAKPPCAACHPSGRFASTPIGCVSCHKADDKHDGRFGTDCSACHSTESWSGATIDHSLTAFPLTGAHKSVSCTSCHRNNVFAGTPTACSACHSKPSTHQPASFSSCQQCHTTVSWGSAQFKAAHSFPLRHGGANAVCTRCHVSSWAVYTCARCHSNAKMIEHHKEVAGFSLTTCVRCHPTGRGD